MTTVASIEKYSLLYNSLPAPDIEFPTVLAKSPYNLQYMGLVQYKILLLALEVRSELRLNDLRHYTSNHFSRPRIKTAWSLSDSKCFLVTPIFRKNRIPQRTEVA